MQIVRWPERGLIRVSANTLVEEIAKVVALTQPTDLPALVTIQEKLQALSEQIQEDDLRALCRVADKAAGLIDAIVLRETDDIEQAYSCVQGAVSYTQEAMEAHENGRSIDSITLPRFPGEPEPVPVPVDIEIDEELLSAWVSSCEDTLAELEANVVEIDTAEDPAELIGAIRRGVHTIKGECGVLSLHTAQKVCHEAESAIDVCIDNNEPFPVDPVLALLDWVKDYVARLSQDPRSPCPAHEELLQVFVDITEPASVKFTPTAEPESAVETETPVDEPDVAQPVLEQENIPASESASEPEQIKDDGSRVTFPDDLGMDENLNDFLCEAREHLTAAEEALLSLEQDFGDIELINTIFRAFHTIKGVAGFMNLTPIVELAHNAETLLDKARNGEITLNPEYTDLIFRSCDLLLQLIATLEGTEAPAKIVFDSLVAELKRVVAGGAPGSNQAETPPAVVASTPAPVESTPETKATETESSAPAASEAPAPVTETPSEPQAPAAKSDTPTTQSKPSPNTKAKRRTEQTVKVSTGRMDALVNMVGELVIAQQMIVQDSQVSQIKEQKTQRNLTHVGKIIRDLQEVAMSLRMVTIKAQFQKMARLVRDLSIKAGKNIEFKMEGEDTELDRNVVEEIADPLVHMVRNSCDHGIEPEGVRVQEGKTPHGTLTLRAYHQGGSIVIEVQDDGKGLNRDKILAKALDRGLIPADRNPAEIPDSEIYNMVFLPGFSTADKVTDISGRGVGMDVVRRNIEALRGKVEIRSTPGEGSTFIMRLPLTMAIIDGMIVRVGSQRYVLPTLSIEQSFRPKPDQLHTAAGGKGEMAMVRDALLPVYRLNRVFDLEEGADAYDESLLIVIESNSSRCCLLVDEILGQQQVVIKNLGEGVDSLRGVSGGAILGDGRVALILDVMGLINEATNVSV